MIHIIEVNMRGRRTLVDSADDFTTAKAKVEAMGVSFMEDDKDHSDCADAFMSDGRVLAIQPANFEL